MPRRVAFKIPPIALANSSIILTSRYQSTSRQPCPCEYDTQSVQGPIKGVRLFTCLPNVVQRATSRGSPRILRGMQDMMCIRVTQNAHHSWCEVLPVMMSFTTPLPIKLAPLWLPRGKIRARRRLNKSEARPQSWFHLFDFFVRLLSTQLQTSNHPDKMSRSALPLEPWLQEIFR